MLDERTIKVSPFAGSSHICPKDDTDDVAPSSSSTSASYASVLSSYIPDNFLSKKGISRIFAIQEKFEFEMRCTEELVLNICLLDKTAESLSWPHCTISYDNMSHSNSTEGGVWSVQR